MIDTLIETAFIRFEHIEMVRDDGSLIVTRCTICIDDESIVTGEVKHITSAEHCTTKASRRSLAKQQAINKLVNAINR